MAQRSTIETRSPYSRACRLVMFLGFSIDQSHRQSSFWSLIKWFLWDYKNNFLLQLARNNWFLGSTISIQFLRPVLLRWRGAKIGKHVAIGEGTIIGLTYADQISIGNNCRISAHVIINEHGRSLENYGPGVELLDLPVYSKAVVIERDCHIGVGAIILPGVVIGRGSIVGAGSVIREDVPPFSLVVGNPGKVVKTFKRTITEKIGEGEAES